MKKLIQILLVLALGITNYACGQSTSNRDFPTVTPQVFLSDIHENPDAYVLDVRTPDEFEQGHLQGAHNLDWLDTSAFEAGVPELPKDRTLYIYCRSGGRSAKASQYLSERGYKVVNLAGGYSDLKSLSQ